MITPGSSTVFETTPAAAPATAAAGIRPAAALGAPAFDAILMLQNLAATTGCLDTASLDPAETTDLIAGDDTDEDENGEELEATLAFLSELIIATTPKSSARDFEAGAQPQGDSPEETVAAAAPAKGGVDFTETAGDILEAAADDAGDGKSLLTAMSPELHEPRTRSGQDATQNLARAAEMLMGQPRAIATPEKHGVTTHVRDPRWADDFSNRVALMVRGAESTASLQLTPVDLGPVEVNVTVKDSQATVHFGASHADTRALIEASLPRLRELLASQGFNLMDASVSSGFKQSQGQGGQAAGSGASEIEPAGTDARTARALGLLDVYA
jgi:flagellar hook-length control protein FliK